MSAREIIFAAIEKKISTEPELRALKVATAGVTGKLLRNADLIAAYVALVREGTIDESETLRQLLLKRKVRSHSGVSVVTVLTKPFGCPGHCTFCPTAVGMPKSYLPDQPGAMRAVRNDFDPYRQVSERLASLAACGHPAEKIELIILGGTWTALPKKYQNWFIRRCMQAMNTPLAIKTYSTSAHRSKTNGAGNSLKELQKQNESAHHRLVGLTVETRPDWLDAKEIRYQRRLGVTRVELGVQSIFDDVLRHTKRGHDNAKTIETIRNLKNAGLKVGLHLMPNLPLASPKRDEEMFVEIFSGSDYCPDQMKIYPCSVLPDTQLEKEWRAGSYKPYSEKKLITLLKKIYPLVPEYCRISRVVRDIPERNILAGARTSNLRQTLEIDKTIKTREIRTREIKGDAVDPRDVKLVEKKFVASGEEEYFLSFEDVKHDKLIAFARLRLMTNGIAFIRELHSYGWEMPIGHAGRDGQHRGYGRRLLTHAEELARTAGMKKICIPAGIGVRPYYAKLGYTLWQDYMTKNV